MQKSYTLNYLKIYFWQGLSILVSFASMFVVIPMLSKTPALYGIYSICVSLNIFLSYADLGFLSAGFKYASECHARNDQGREIRITGFIAFLMLAVIVPFFIASLALSFHPSWLIKGLTNPDQVKTASSLLLILALFSPAIILQRLTSIIFGVRVHDYIPRRISIVTGTIAVASALYFFTGGRYDLTGYYLFVQSMNLVASVLSLVLAKTKYGYSIMALVRAFRFNRKIFEQTKKLAFTTLFGTVCLVLYYELDTILIARFLGAEQVALYAICLTFFNFFRSIYGTVYGPFTARFNHFVGMKDISGLRSFFLSVIRLTAPVLFPVIALFLLMSPFIQSWVGPGYAKSVSVGSILILVYAYSFVHYPASILMQAQEKIRAMNVLSVANVVLFWAGILLLTGPLGINAFAVMKLSTFVLSAAVYTVFSVRFLKIDILEFSKKIFLPLLIPAVAVGAAAYFAGPLLPIVKNKWNLVVVILCGGGASLFGLLLYTAFSKSFRDYVAGFLKKISLKRKTT